MKGRKIVEEDLTSMEIEEIPKRKNTKRGDDVDDDYIDIVPRKKKSKRR